MKMPNEREVRDLFAKIYAVGPRPPRIALFRTKTGKKKFIAIAKRMAKKEPRDAR